MNENLGLLVTESNNPDTRGIGSADSLTIVKLINAEDKKIAGCVEKELPQIAKAIDLVSERLQKGGKLFYFGAGTSGRLGVIDASECQPTYGVPQEMVQGIIAGGYGAIINASSGNEDDFEAGESEIADHGITAADAVCGIAASGRTPYVLGVLTAAKKAGCVTIGITNNPDTKIAQIADVTIAPVTGPEAIQGSSRMKAGTAQKMVLNMLSTGVMIQLGKVYQNYMVDMVASNEKLLDRAKRLVVQITGCEEAVAEKTLAGCEQNVKTAVVSILAGVTPEDAQKRLDACGGFADRALQMK